MKINFYLLKSIFILMIKIFDYIKVVIKLNRSIEM